MNDRNEDQSGRSHHNDVGAEFLFVIEPSFLKDRLSGKVLLKLLLTSTSPITCTKTVTAKCSNYYWIQDVRNRWQIINKPVTSCFFLNSYIGLSMYTIIILFFSTIRTG